MKALSVEKLPEGDWLYEIKFDGYRALAFKDGKDVRLVSRRTLPYVRAWEAKYREHGLVVIGMQTPEFAFEKERVCRSLNWRKRTWQQYSTMMR